MQTHVDLSSLCLISSLLSPHRPFLNASASMLSSSRRGILVTTLLLTLTRSHDNLQEEDQVSQLRWGIKSTTIR